MRSRYAGALAALALGVAGVVAGCHDRGNRDERTVIVDGKVNVVADEHGFTPGSVELPKGSPATLVFTRTTDDTCATQVVFPELKVTKDLPRGSAVAIDVPTDAPRTLTFQCGMGMFKGKVVVR